MTNPPGAMPPLPARECGPHTGHIATWTPQQMEDYAKSYAAPLVARVAELERQNESQKDEWLSWDAKRAALEKDAARWQMASTSRNHGITDWNEHGQRTLYDALATQVIDAAIAAKD